MNFLEDAMPYAIVGVCLYLSAPNAFLTKTMKAQALLHLWRIQSRRSIFTFTAMEFVYPAKRE